MVKLLFSMRLLYDFPAIHTSGSPAKAIKVNGVAYSVARGGKYEWANNCYYYGTDGTKDLGLAAEGIIFDTSSPKTSCTGIIVHDCHFEMRLNGVVLGMKRTNYNQVGKVSGAKITNSTFSHHYFQPIGMHAENVVVENVSGDYVLTGGELPAAIISDALVRLVPGVLSDEQSALSDSFQDNLLAAPVYTRPADYKGWKVPDILLSGHDAKIKEWELLQSMERTKRLRPDLLK